MVDSSGRVHPPHRAEPVPGILDPGERAEVEATFGVDSEQVARDHVISHALAAISGLGTDDLVFPARFRVLTPAAFVASKLSAWHDRQTSRDLYDLWALADAGHVSSTAVELFERLGPLTDASKVDFTRLPSAAEWEASLAHQCLPRVGPTEAAGAVRQALGLL